MRHKPSRSKILNFLPHPSLIIYIILSVIAGRFFLMICAGMALFIHEFAHIAVARKLGFRPEKFSLTPFGATLSYDCGLSDTDTFKMTVAGPLANLIACPLIITLWWLVPSTYSFTLIFCQNNFSLALFNLLPVFPFDGGRIILSLSKNKIRSYKILKVAGIVISSILIVSGSFLAIYYRGYSILIAGFSILWSVLFDSKDERYRLIFDNTGVIHDFSKPFTKQEIYVHTSTLLKDLLKCIDKKNCLYSIHIVNNSLAVIRTLENEEVNSLFFKDRKMSLGNLLELPVE